MSNCRRRILSATCGILLLVSLPSPVSGQDYSTISAEELREKIEGYWIGQLVGNFMGFPFEWMYREEPAPVFIDRYYNMNDSTDLRINTDRRGYVHILGEALGGAWTDDDTDIEFVTLHAVEQYGLDITYAEITEAWKTHINRFVWGSNSMARQLMEQGLVPPETGSRENNPYWMHIDPGLVNEIWSVFYPGMVEHAVERAAWGAGITNDGWGTHPTQFYAALYSAAFFENDIEKLYATGMASLPDNSPFLTGLRDVQEWHRIHSDWRKTRDLIYENYYGYPEDMGVHNDVSALLNGLFGAMAILYGNGDFTRTTGIAVTAGMDCDNQAATCAGLMGVLNGASAIPEHFTTDLGDGRIWELPFNNQYINYSRDNLPNMTLISDLVDRIMRISERAILENGGEKITKDGEIHYVINHPLVDRYSRNLPRSTPEAEGISSTSILSFIESLEQEIDAVHSFMLLRHGKLISSGWWDPFGPKIPHVMHSLSKSFTSTAIGLAVGEGLISMDDPVISFFPEESTKEPTWQWKEMRIRDLLTMNTGHLTEPRPPAGEDNWVGYFLHSEVELMPGTHFRYNSMATYMLSAILQKVTGEKLADYLGPRLFEPLQIATPRWDTCPMGINTGGWGLHIVTEDIAKLGQLYLQKGKWEGRQLLSEKWVEMATSKQVSNGSNPDNDWAQGYGFQFWRCRHNCYRGDGAMGQFCIVMPDQQAVLAITSGTSDMGKIMQLAWDHLLPAMQERSLPPDPDALQKLERKTADLKLLPVPGESGPRASFQKRYRITGANEGIRAVSFDFRKDTQSITLETDEGTATIPVGSDGYIKTDLPIPLPFTNPRYLKAACSGAWTAPGQYSMRIYLYETPARVTYTFHFGEDKLIWESRPEHSLFGPGEAQSLQGTLL